MSFLERLNDAAKPNVDHILFDFRLGDGIEKVFLRDIPFATKQRLVAGRMKKGRDAEGKPTFELDLVGEAMYLDAEIIASSVCDEDGKLLFGLPAVKEWDSNIVRRLAKVISDKIDLFGLKEDDSSPSQGQS